MMIIMILIYMHVLYHSYYYIQVSKTLIFYKIYCTIGNESVHSMIKEFTAVMQCCKVCLSVIGAVSRLIQLYIINGETNKGDNIQQLMTIIKYTRSIVWYIVSSVCIVHQVMRN